MAQTGVPAEKSINPLEGRESAEKPSSDIAASTPLDGVEESSDASRLKMVRNHVLSRNSRLKFSVDSPVVKGSIRKYRPSAPT